MKRPFDVLVSAGVCVALATPATAQVTYWTGFVDTDWSNPSNWGSGVPTTTGHGIIWPGPTPPPPDYMPILQTNQTMSIWSPTWNGGTSHTGIDGGTLDVTDYVRLSSADNYHHVMSVDNGGVLSTPTIQMAMTSGPGNATARININNGAVYAGVQSTGGGGIGFAYPDTVPAGTPATYANAGQNIDIEVGSTLHVAGNRVTSGEADWWVNGWQNYPEAGRMVTAVDGTGDVQAFYNPSTGYTEFTAVDSYTPIWSASFEDGEVNAAYISGVVGNGINTEPLPATQPSPFSASASATPDDGYGWTNRAAGWVGGDTTVVDTIAFLGENSAQVENRTLRSDIPLTVEEGVYRFRFWYLVPSGEDLSFGNKIVIKDQTNNFMFYTEDNIIEAPAHDVWFSRTFTFDTTGYAHLGEEIQLRFGAWFQDDQFDVFYTDAWSLAFSPIPEPASFVLLGFGGLSLLRRRRQEDRT